jgi:AcrR family transcriptional regulator
MSSSPATGTRLPREQRREAILDAAAKVLAQQPCEAVSMSDIVRASDVSRPVVYDHFATRQAIVIALIRRHHQVFVDALRQVIAQGGIVDEATYRALLNAAFDHFESDPAGWRLLCYEPSADPAIAAAQRETRDEVLALGRAAFHLPPGSETVLEGLRTAINGLFAWQRDCPGVSREQLVDAAVQLTWHGLARARRS